MANRKTFLMCYAAPWRMGAQPLYHFIGICSENEARKFKKIVNSDSIETFLKHFCWFNSSYILGIYQITSWKVEVVMAYWIVLYGLLEYVLNSLKYHIYEKPPTYLVVKMSPCNAIDSPKVRFWGGFIGLNTVIFCKTYF